ncbi:MAG: GTPase HflX [Patescibacteria group bacterium]|jgi:GTP-binding protein HflX
MSNPAGAYKAILADVVHFSVTKAEALERMAELEALTQTYGGIAVVKAIQRRDKPDFQTFIGSGKLEEIIAEAKDTGANVLIVNDILKPGQLFRLEEALEPVKMKVWDRVDLILHIFDRHATSAEAKLEIELARLRHIGPRIYNMGAQLGKQGGGTGVRGGAGESNTEKMKRHIKERERAIVKKLEGYESGRAEHRKSRVRAGFKTVALVGYTNAGKTALLNVLTKRKEISANKLFATLDTRVGEIYLPELGASALLSDTIGFIRDLPPSLIKAFRSTLSEAVHADLLLHVIDSADPKLDLKRAVVENILASLGLADRPTILVYNKCDLLPKNLKREDGICVSAVTKDGLPTLKEKIAAMLR